VCVDEGGRSVCVERVCGGRYEKGDGKRKM